jgi:hypothetical protein
MTGSGLVGFGLVGSLGRAGNTLVEDFLEWDMMAESHETPLKNQMSRRIRILSCS